MAKVINYYSVSDVLSTECVALVYTDEILVKDNISEYRIEDKGRFPYSTLVYKLNQDENVYFIELTEATRTKFNYILMISNSGMVSAFIQLSDTIDLVKYHTETVTIKFELTISTERKEIALSIDSVISDWNLHTTHLMSRSNNPMLSKSDIIDMTTDIKPYVSDVTDYKDDSSTVLKYSGSIFLNSGYVVNPYEFDISDLNINNLVRVIECNNSVLLAYYDSDNNKVKLIGSNMEFSLPENYILIDVTSDYVICSNEDKNFLIPLNEAISGDSSPIELNESMKYIVDSVTGDTYFYRDGIQCTYGYSVNSGSRVAKEVYCSSKMQSILENLSHDITNDNSSIIYHEHDSELLAITEGLAVYLNKNGKLKLHSSFSISSNYQYELDKDYTFVTVISSRAILVNDLEKYYILELQNKSNIFEWVELDLGYNGYLYNIFMLAKHKHTNPKSEITKLTYKGNLFGIFNQDNKTYLRSL